MQMDLMIGSLDMWSEAPYHIWILYGGRIQQHIAMRTLLVIIRVSISRQRERKKSSIS